MKAAKLFMFLCSITVLISLGCNQDNGVSKFIEPANGSSLTTNGMPAQSPLSIEHSVTGSGAVTYFGVSFRNSIAAHSDASGNAWGEVTVPIDLTAFGEGMVTFSGHVNCLSIDGNNAWIGFIVEHSTNENGIPTGVNAIALVRDLGGSGEDIADGEIFPPEVQCTDHPTEFLETVVLNGNYTVR